MSSMEPDTIVGCDPHKATDTDFTPLEKDVKRRGGIDSANSQIAHSVSSSEEPIGDTRLQHDAARASADMSNESVSSKEDEHSDEDSDSSTSESENENLKPWLDRQPKKVNIKWSNYESFSNRFSFEEGLDIIEVLEGSPEQLRTDMLHERSKRRHKKHSESQSKRQTENNSKFIYRVRIQSPAIIHVLGRLSAQEDWDDPCLIFMRPFHAFYYTLSFAKQVLNALEREFNDGPEHDGNITTRNSAMDRSYGVSSIESDDPLHKLSIPSDVDIDDIVYSLADFKSEATSDHTAMEHMRVYIEFVEKHIAPMWVEARGSSNLSVRFSDLPMYFRPGDIVVCDPRTGDDKGKAGNTGNLGSYASRSQGQAIHHNYWKLCYAQFQEPLPAKRNKRPVGNIGKRMLSCEFRLYCFHVDYDGDSYGPVSWEINIAYYEGEMDIRSLYAFPLRFSPDARQISNNLTTRAKNFLSYVRQRHLSYDGWTLVHQADGGTINHNQNQKQTRAEHIEGEVMIDFKEGFQSNFGFVKSVLSLPRAPEYSGATSVDPLLSIDHTTDLQTQWWLDTARSKKKGKYDDNLLTKEIFCYSQRSHLMKEHKDLRAFEEEEMVANLSLEHLLLFPQRLIAYSFRARKFFLANIDCISFITTPESPFRDLKIESENKRILKSLVGRHFEKQDIRRQNKDANLGQDFIRGKGSGLVILLHGVPGVGKTTTAEAVALDNRKPLFALTSGDLGSTSSDVETALRETFRLAAMWNCVLLLDEADLFLAKRDVGDLVRNSLVSVFLRVLDYYDGVLFLTTNRVGTVDEAFRSRIHLSLYYPPLRKKQAQEIFKLNIRRIKEIEKSKEHLRGKEEQDQSKLPRIEIDESSILNFATQQWEKTRRNPSRRWNGRQIRNSFQIAYSLVNLGEISVTTSHHDDDYDDDYDDDKVDYDEEPIVDAARSKGQDLGAPGTSPGGSVQFQKPGKLDSSQFEIVERSIRRFDKYLDITRGPDSDYAKSKNTRRDDYAESDDEDRYARDHGRYYDAEFPRSSPRRETYLRSPATPGYSAPPSDRGERPQRTPGRDRDERLYGNRRAPPSGDADDDYVEEMRRPRAGGPHGYSPRSRRGEHDDGYTRDSYR